MHYLVIKLAYMNSIFPDHQKKETVCHFRTGDICVSANALIEGWLQHAF